MTALRNAVILAAGRGGRMRPLTDRIPKALAPVGDRTLLAEQFRRVGSWADRIHVTCGYRKEEVVAEALQLGAASVVDIGDHGNAWWIGGSALGLIEEPTLVITCDNFLEIDIDSVLQDYEQLDEPSCLLIPTAPSAGKEGDFISHEDGLVTALTRLRPSPTYCTGLQILRPSAIRRMDFRGESFNELWSMLIDSKALKVSSCHPSRWTAVDSLDHLRELEEWIKATPNQAMTQTYRRGTDG